MEASDAKVVGGWLVGMVCAMQFVLCVLSVGTIRFEDKLCTSRKGGIGGGGWVHCSA